MRPLVALLLAGCAFDPVPVEPATPDGGPGPADAPLADAGGGDSASGDARGDAPAADAPLFDALVADAVVPDASPDAVWGCGGAAQPLALGTTLIATTVGGGDSFTPTCQSDDGAERLYQVEVPADTVVTVTVTPQGDFDAILSAHGDCAGGAGTVLGCTDGLYAEGAEVIRLTAAGTAYLFVDSFDNVPGSYTISVESHALRASGETCDNADLRCAAGLLCVAGTCQTPPSCTPVGTDLPLDTLATATAGATGSFTPPGACAATTLGETYYTVDVPASDGTGHQDLVVEAGADGGGFNAVVDVLSACWATTLTCANAFPTSSLNEAAVVRDIGPGRAYVVVDSVAGGSYWVYAYSRPLLTDGAPCDRTVASDRCQAGFCVGGEIPVCDDAVTPVTEGSGGNDICSQAEQPPRTSSFVLNGHIDAVGDSTDQYAVTLTAGMTLYATVIGPDGTCGFDAMLTLRSGPCGTQVTLVDDDDDGFAYCPSLSYTTSSAGEVRVGVSATAGSGNYTLIVDLI